MMNEQTVAKPMRLDQFVAHAFHLSRSQAAKRTEEGCVQCNGEIVTKASKKVRAGDIITLRIKENTVHLQPATCNLQPEAIPVLYEDSTCLVVDKPAGITVHPARTTKGEPTLIDIVRKQYGENLQLVHRLDRETTGCLLIAKTTEAHDILQKQFKNRTVKKSYLAIVAGVPKEKRATIEANIGRSLMNRMKMSLFRTGTSREASTSYEVLRHANEVSLLRCDLHTGRTHQIRVHLSSIGHPILGDEKYGNDSSTALAKKLNIPSLMLHAEALKFVSPDTSEEVHISAETPITMKIAIAEEILS
jgi:23S rRNA pseudouridine1911/1915/1917 synthase